MAQACGFEAVVRYQHTRHALPLDFFHQHGDQNIAQIAVQTDERLVQQGKVAAAQQQAQKCYPFRHAAGQFGRIFVQIARSQPDFRRQRDDFAFIGFVHKNSDILHRGQVFRQAVFLKQKTRFAESIAYRARFRRFQARNQTQNRRLATAARPEQSFHFAMLQVQTEIVHDGVTENFKTHVFKTEVGGQAVLGKTSLLCNSLAHRTTWLRSDFHISHHRRSPPDSASVLACAITIYCGFGVSKIPRQAHE